MNKQNKSYCRYAFDSVTVTNTGHMQLCCYAEWTGHLEKEKAKLKDINSIDDWFDGKYLTNTRKSMLENKKLPECAGCYRREKQFGQSPRTWANDKYFKDNLSFTESSIKRVDLKFGNKCNLACIMCDGYSSSLHIKEKEQHTVPKHLKQFIPTKAYYQDFTKDQLEELLQKNNAPWV